MNKYSNKIRLQLDNNTIEKSQDDFEILDYYPQLKLLKTGEYYDKKYQDNYFCYNYAFHDKSLEEVEDSFRILLHEYDPIEKKNAKQGDIISFHSIEKETRGLHRPDFLNCNHFAILSEIKINLNTGKEIIYIKSKWGILGVFEGSILDLPDTYGNCFVIWRQKKKISPTTKRNSVRDKTGRFCLLTK